MFQTYPHVAGVAAMLYSVNPNLSGTDVKQILISTATEEYCRGDVFHNLVDANAAVEEAIRRKASDSTIGARTDLEGSQTKQESKSLQEILMADYWYEPNDMDTSFERYKFYPDGTIQSNYFHYNLDNNTVTLYEHNKKSFRYEIRNENEVAIIRIADENWSDWESIYEYDPIKDRLFMYADTEWESGDPYSANFYITHVSANSDEELLKAFTNGRIVAYDEVPKKDATTQLSPTEGTIPAGVIPIYTPHDLYNIRNNLSGSYILINDIDLGSWGNWEPIGNKDNPFTGSLNGNEYVIKNILIKVTDSRNVGLFDEVINGNIKNLGIVDGNIQYEGLHGVSVGAFAGHAGGKNLFENCYTNCSVSSKSDYGKDSVGGIVGTVYGSDEMDFLITNSYSTGDVNCFAPYGSAGGIVGTLRDERGTISRCYSTGNISISSNVASGASVTANAGGIIGSLNPSGGYTGISDCYSLGNISASRNIQDERYTFACSVYAGGIAGEARGSHINSCYSAGNVKAIAEPNETVAHAGGILGRSWGFAVNIYGKDLKPNFMRYNPLDNYTRARKGETIRMKK